MVMSWCCCAYLGVAGAMMGGVLSRSLTHHQVVDAMTLQKTERERGERKMFHRSETRRRSVRDIVVYMCTTVWLIQTHPSSMPSMPSMPLSLPPIPHIPFTLPSIHLHFSNPYTLSHSATTIIHNCDSSYLSDSRRSEVSKDVIAGAGPLHIDRTTVGNGGTLPYSQAVLPCNTSPLSVPRPPAPLRQCYLAWQKW